MSLSRSLPDGEVRLLAVMLNSSASRLGTPSQSRQIPIGDRKDPTLRALHTDHWNEAWEERVTLWSGFLR